MEELLDQDLEALVVIGRVGLRHDRTPWHQIPKAGTDEQSASRPGARQHAMLPSRSVPGRLDSQRVRVIQAIGEATTVIANQASCSVAIACVRNPSTGRQVVDLSPPRVIRKMAIP